MKRAPRLVAEPYTEGEIDHQETKSRLLTPGSQDVLAGHFCLCKALHHLGRCQEDAEEEEGFDPAELVTDGDIADWSNPERESGLEWDTGADAAPPKRAVPRLGNNPWVTRDLSDPSSDEEGLYFPEQQWADQTPPMICPGRHAAYYKPSVGTHICPTCGAMYLPRQGEWSEKSR